MFALEDASTTVAAPVGDEHGYMSPAPHPRSLNEALAAAAVGGVSDPPSRVATPPPPASAAAPPVPAIAIPRVGAVPTSATFSIPTTALSPGSPYVVTGGGGGGDGRTPGGDDDGYASDSGSDEGGLEIGKFLSARSPLPSRRAFTIGSGAVPGSGGGSARQGAAAAAGGSSARGGVPSLGDVSARSTARSRNTPGRGAGGSAWWASAAPAFGGAAGGGGSYAAAESPCAAGLVSVALRRNAALAAEFVMFLMEAVLDGGAGDGGCALREALACVRSSSSGCGEARSVGADGLPRPHHAGDNAVYWMQRLFEASQGGAPGDFGAALHAGVGAAVAALGCTAHARLLRLIDPGLFNAARFGEGEFIAAGAYGRVSGCSVLTGPHAGARVAVKASRGVIAAPTSRCRVTRMLTDVAIMEAAAAAGERDAGVVALLDYGVVGEEYWLVMERADVNLRAWRLHALGGGRPLTHADVPAGLTAVCVALRIIARLHSRGAALFDIKGDNFLLRHAPPRDCAVRGVWERELAITDLGDAVVASGGGGGGVAVEGAAPRTECTASPEMLLRRETAAPDAAAAAAGVGAALATPPPVVTAASDVWTAGCLVYEVLTGAYLFDESVAQLCARLADPGARCSGRARRCRVFFVVEHVVMWAVLFVHVGADDDDRNRVDPDTRHINCPHSHRTVRSPAGVPLVSPAKGALLGDAAPLVLPLIELALVRDAATRPRLDALIDAAERALAGVLAGARDAGAL